VYRRRGYQYGVIRLVEEAGSGTEAGQANGRAKRAEEFAAR
jgi:hypothetical protein